MWHFSFCFFFFYNLTHPFYLMFMHLSKLPIGLDLLVHLRDHFYQRLLRSAKQKILLYQM